MAQSGVASAKQQYSRSVGCPTTNFVSIVCKNKAHKYLSLNGDIPSFYLSHADQYTQVKEDGSSFDIMKKTCGLDIEICGILRIEHTENNGYSADMRVIYYAEPMDNDKEYKQEELTKSAQWIDVPDKNAIKKMIENSALYSWINYLEYENGVIYPIELFCVEHESVKIPNYSMPQIQNHNANYFNLVKSKTDEMAKMGDNDEKKTQSK